MSGAGVPPSPPPARGSGLRVTEIFTSLQGEAREMGRPTVFVRLTGCPLRCRYCDTAHAFSGGTVRSLEGVLEQVAAAGVGPVCVTGGEPLAQPACLPLLSALCDAGHEVSLETGGALDVSGVDPRVVKVLDLKTPGSGESHRNLWSNLDHLGPRDQVKFVLMDRADYDWARWVMERHALPERVEVLLSPVADRLSPVELAEWIVADRLPVRFQWQLHKLLWGDARGR
ncbi:7-carboxy-7-deazaguanine synthase QueE [Ectothiorhodospira mobilis]|uniref:7-carboxy-7-deazaguanine synthase QueE n=1 Tax=Ectothiorhodospira mobilis TaxID=195064 RepID=UPI001904E95B|nr:7-carboxy-7-deazaguanine synthase QueE [Ectothiorhodospira mobilis]